ncbi:MAG: hypothetical protein J7M38_06685 [Armatimonadetes bacterium]|nr:hypothetical protein [Armatimonadota bacterium]
MSEAEVIRARYERIVAADFPNSGKIGDDEPRVKAVERSGCHGHSRNLLFLSFHIRDGVLRQPKYECLYCDVVMYIVAEVVSELIADRPVSTLAEIGDAEITAALGGESRKVVRLARTALRLVREAAAD